MEAYQAQPRRATTVSLPEICEAIDTNAAIKGKESTIQTPFIPTTELDGMYFNYNKAYKCLTLCKLKQHKQP